MINRLKHCRISGLLEEIPIPVLALTHATRTKHLQTKNRFQEKWFYNSFLLCKILIEI